MAKINTTFEHVENNEVCLSQSDLIELAKKKLFEGHVPCDIENIDFEVDENPNDDNPEFPGEGRYYIRVKFATKVKSPVASSIVEMRRV